MESSTGFEGPERFRRRTNLLHWKKKLNTSIQQADWANWRGPNRDGIASWLPQALPAELKEQWRCPLPSIGLGGISATRDLVIVSARDALDQQDVFLGLDAETGRKRWMQTYRAAGTLDYGRGPRATPIIGDEFSLLLGAFGHLTCVQTASGLKVWQRNLVRDDQAPLPTWGFCGTPMLLDDESVVVQTGSPAGSLLCVRIADGQVLWQSGNEPISYSSFIAVDVNGQRQLVGYDERSVGGWHAQTGERLWTITPEETGDFNVVTPIFRDGNLWLASENNGIRRYEFQDGRPQATPAAANPDLLPDTHTPVLLDDNLWVVHHGLHCLDAQTLQPRWSNTAEVFSGHASIIASPERLLILMHTGDLLLVAADSREYRELGHVKLGEKLDFQSHPALVGNRLYVRVGKALICYDLTDE